MRQNREIYALTLDVLDGERDVHKVLADLLEDQGDRGLAQWARSRKGSRKKRLDFALAMLPGTNAVVLAGDFVEHAIRQADMDSASNAVIDQLSEIRRRVSVSASFQSLADISTAYVEFMDNYGEIRRWRIQFGRFCRSAYAAVGEGAAELMLSRSAAELYKSRYHEHQAKVFVRKAARLGRDAIRHLQSGHLGTPAQHDELGWQLDHTRNALEQLLTD